MIFLSETKSEETKVVPFIMPEERARALANIAKTDKQIQWEELLDEGETSDSSWTEPWSKKLDEDEDEDSDWEQSCEEFEEIMKEEDDDSAPEYSKHQLVLAILLTALTLSLTIIGGFVHLIAITIVTLISLVITIYCWSPMLPLIARNIVRIGHQLRLEITRPPTVFMKKASPE